MKCAPAHRPYTQTARAQSAAATGQRIVDAFLERLMQQWFDEITLDRIAKDAGVTVQTVVRRFGGKDGLLADAVKSLGAQINAQRVAPPGNLDRLVANLIKDYERTGDTVIRLLALEPRHPELKAFLDFGRSEHRRWVSSSFAQALDKVDASARSIALDALVIATDVYTWKLLRRDMLRTTTAAQATIKSLIQATLAEFTKQN